MHTFVGGATLITPGDQLLPATDTVSGITGTAVVTVTSEPSTSGQEKGLGQWPAGAARPSLADATSTGGGSALPASGASRAADWLDSLTPSTVDWFWQDRYQGGGLLPIEAFYLERMTEGLIL